MALLATLLAGVVFGLALAAPPGPMNAIIAEETVLRGWLAGLIAGLGAMVADLCFFLLALAGVIAIVQKFPLLQGTMVAVGGLLMLYFAYGAARDASAMLSTTDLGESKGFQKAFVLALTNPYQVLFWLTVGVGLLTPGRQDLLAETPYVGDTLAGVLVVETGSVALVAGLFGGILAWIIGFPAMLVTAERRIESLAPVVAYASAAVLGVFGVYFLGSAFGTFFKIF